jgi:hypothetical protein
MTHTLNGIIDTVDTAENQISEPVLSNRNVKCAERRKARETKHRMSKTCGKG